jgi:hypothetical protein
MNAEGDEVDALERDVDRIRNNIGELIRELNYRRHEAFDLKLQFQRHAARVILAGAAMFAVVAGAIVLAVARQRRRRSIGARVTRLRQALRRISAHPEQLAGRPPSVSRKVAAAGGSAIASVLGKRLAKRLVSG